MACLRNSWRMTASLPLNHRPPTTSIVQRRYVLGSNNSHKSERSIIHYFSTATTEQHTFPPDTYTADSAWGAARFQGGQTRRQTHPQAYRVSTF